MALRVGEGRQFLAAKNDGPTDLARLGSQLNTKHPMNKNYLRPRFGSPLRAMLALGLGLPLVPGLTAFGQTTATPAAAVPESNEVQNMEAFVTTGSSIPVA